MECGRGGGVRWAGRWETESRVAAAVTRERKVGGVAPSWHRRSEQAGVKLDQNGFGSN